MLGWIQYYNKTKPLFDYNDLLDSKGHEDTITSDDQQDDTKEAIKNIDRNMFRDLISDDGLEEFDHYMNRDRFNNMMLKNETVDYNDSHTSHLTRRKL